jgi:aryl-alcohol dehydrogenase-like predicted oxidoreductase
MAKTPKKNARKKAQAAKAKPEAEKKVSRREALLWSKWTAGAVVAIGAGGTWLSNAVVVAAAEHDLSRIGTGVPTVVQVHDPQCPLCTQLQRETRKSLKQFDRGDMLYLIADINRPEGREFARVHNVGNVTLVLMDGAGNPTQIINGVHTRAQLDPILANHFAAHGAG